MKTSSLIAFIISFFMMAGFCQECQIPQNIKDPHSSYIFQREGECHNDCGHDPILAKKVYAHLFKKSPTSITFDETKIDDYQAKSSCSAMALDFATRYLKECSKLTKIDEVIAIMKEYAPIYRLSTTTFNSRQAAYNTITIDRDAYLDNPEYMKYLKMQSLANYHGLALTPASESIQLVEIKEQPKAFRRIISALPVGIYIVRALKPEDNRKMEKFGHTMVFVKRGKFSLFYDNRDGAVNITKDPESYVENKIIAWDIPEVRFYRAAHVQNEPYNLSTEKIFK